MVHSLSNLLLFVSTQVSSSKQLLQYRCLANLASLVLRCYKQFSLLPIDGSWLGLTRPALLYTRHPQSPTLLHPIPITIQSAPPSRLYFHILTYIPLFLHPSCLYFRPSPIAIQSSPIHLSTSPPHHPFARLRPGKRRYVDFRTTSLRPLLHPLPPPHIYSHNYSSLLTSTPSIHASLPCR